jgi:hypothetical protein
MISTDPMYAKKIKKSHQSIIDIFNRLMCKGSISALLFQTYCPKMVYLISSHNCFLKKIIIGNGVVLIKLNLNFQNEKKNIRNIYSKKTFVRKKYNQTF